MSPNPQHGRPALLRLAVELAPEDRRLWLEDMAAEFSYVSSGDRTRWLLAAVGLALRWRIASWRQVPAPHLAVALMALALLAGSPWLMRSYLMQNNAPITETDPPVAPSFDNTGARGQDVPTDRAESAAGEQFADALGTVEEQPRDAAAAAPAPVVAPAEQRADADDAPVDEIDAASLQDAERLRPNGVDGAADLNEPPANQQLPEAELAPLDPAATVRESAQAGALTTETQIVMIEGDTLSLSVLRATRLEIRAGSSPDDALLVDRDVEPGERFLLLLPVLVSTADGGALEAGALGPLGADGQAIVRRFVSESAPARGE